MSDDTKNTLCGVAIPNPKALSGWNICHKPGVTNLGTLSRVEFPSSGTDQVVLILCRGHDAEGTNRRPMAGPKVEATQIVQVPKDKTKKRTRKSTAADAQAAEKLASQVGGE